MNLRWIYGKIPEIERLQLVTYLVLDPDFWPLRIRCRQEYLLSAVLPLKESSRELIVEVLRALEPYFPDITERWRDRLGVEFGFGRREIVALERLTSAVACSYCCHGDFAGFFENLHYYGTRLAKLQTDTRSVAQAMEAYQELCEPYLHDRVRRMPRWTSFAPPRL